MAETETCANCHATIGNLETPFLHQEHIVCGNCYRKLNAPVAMTLSPSPLEQLAAARQAPPPPQYAPQPPQNRQQVVVVNNGPQWSPGVAALLSLIIPGAGQMYKGQVINGLVWLVAVTVGYFCLVIPGLILHLCCILGAASGAPKSAPIVVHQS